MFHVELRQPPHTVRRLNLSGEELERVLIGPFSRGQPAQIGERSWDPRAQIMVVEGPEIEVGRLTMGRGWAVARKEGSDVTKQVLALIEQRRTAAAREPAAAAVDATPRAGAAAAAGEDTLADALGLELLRRLGEGPMTLYAVWRLASERDPALGAAASLRLAARAVEALAGAGLAAVVRAEAPPAISPTHGPAAPSGEPPIPAGELHGLLGAAESWQDRQGAKTIWLRRI